MHCCTRRKKERILKNRQSRTKLAKQSTSFDCNRLNSSSMMSLQRRKHTGRNVHYCCQLNEHGKIWFSTKDSYRKTCQICFYIKKITANLSADYYSCKMFLLNDRKKPALKRVRVKTFFTITSLMMKKRQLENKGRSWTRCIGERVEVKLCTDTDKTTRQGAIVKLRHALGWDFYPTRHTANIACHAGSTPSPKHDIICDGP